MDLQLSVNAQGRLETPEQFADIIVKTDADGAVTRLVITSYSIHYTKLYESSRRLPAQRPRLGLDRAHLGGGHEVVGVVVERARQHRAEDAERARDRQLV